MPPSTSSSTYTHPLSHANSPGPVPPASSCWRPFSSHSSILPRGILHYVYLDVVATPNKSALSAIDPNMSSSLPLKLANSASYVPHFSLWRMSSFKLIPLENSIHPHSFYLVPPNHQYSFFLQDRTIKASWSVRHLLYRNSYLKFRYDEIKI